MGISDIHLSAKLRITREEAKIRALEVADYIKAHGMKARFTMEDASRTEPSFSSKCVRRDEQQHQGG